MTQFWVLLTLDLLIFAGISFWFFWQRKSILLERDRILVDARKQSDQCLTEGRARLDELSKVKDELYQQKEQSLSHREGLIGLQLQGILEQESNLKQRSARLDERELEISFSKENLDREVSQWRARLSQISGLSPQEARTAYMADVQKQASADALKLSKRILNVAQASADEQAQRIISTAIARCAISHSFENESSIIQLPNDEIKGRIIGREGRNVKFFENITGVTVLVDDSPGLIILSGFDPVRREVAKRAMDALIKEGRFNPTLIEQVVEQADKQVQKSAQDAAQDALRQAGLTLLSEPVLDMLGRLKFRYSYSQNVLTHSVEVATLAGLLAAELGLNVNLARKAGLLHDIGKALSQQDEDNESNHALAGANFLERNSEPPEIVTAVANHHPGEKHSSSEISALTAVVCAADALSAARPGARLETMQSYIKRFKELENIGKSIPAIRKCFALQAGRELRLFAQPDMATDEQCKLIAKFVASKIQAQIQFPGKIRVSVIRELKCDEFAE